MANSAANQQILQRRLFPQMQNSVWCGQQLIRNETIHQMGHMAHAQW